ncbi:MAG: hypothetical protein K2K58_01200 [Muribaculaceae bacterium]|nr:hypothetical protein [Muribaculaceae bacterium]
MDPNYYFNRYGDYGEVDLPKTYRVYFDPYCDEYSRYPVEKKLLDIAYVVTHGFDILKAIKSILESHPHISKRDIQHAIWDLTAAANHISSLPNRKNSLETDIEILIEDLLRYYRLPLDNSIPHYLEENYREVSDQTVFRTNGWEIASENVNDYQMYKDDNFVFYPGDEEVLFKYHKEDIENDNIGQIFPVGPCPEPWYGNPLTAKVIILGDMPKQDDFISRCANIVLSFEPRLMESVQTMVRRWMCLDGSGIYDDTEFRDSGIGVSDAYNSITYRHWITELRNLAWELKVDEQSMFNNLCVLNANAYYSSNGSDPLAAGLLPSQYYLRILVNYLVNNKGENRPIFIIPSSNIHKIWKKVLGYWIENEVMLSNDLILIDQPNIKQRISTNLMNRTHIQNLLAKIR